MRVASEQFPSVLNDIELLNAKEYAYSTGLRLEDLSSVMGVLLRNEILKSKGISVSEVDDTRLARCKTLISYSDFDMTAKN